jgi:hypothetical protein
MVTFIAALADGHTIDAASRAAGVSRQTTWRWLRGDPEFRRAMLRSSDEAWARLEAAESRAAATLVRAATGDADVAPVTVAAATRLLELVRGVRGDAPRRDADTASLASRVAEVYGLPSVPVTDSRLPSKASDPQENEGDPEIVEVEGEAVSPNGPPTGPEKGGE